MEKRAAITTLKNPPPNSSITAVREEQRKWVKKLLGSKGIKLWKPPYYGVREWKKEMQDLAQQFVDEGDDKNDNTAPSLSLPKDLIYENLEHFRAHALGKLRTKGKQLLELNIQVLGGTSGIETIIKDKEFKGDEEDTKYWAEEVEIFGTESTKKNFSIVLRNVNPDLTVQEFEQQLSFYFSSGIRGERKAEEENNIDVRFLTSLVHKSLRKRCNNDEENEAVYLSSRLLGENKNLTGKAKALCIVRRHHHTRAQSQHDPDQELIESIRTAANKLKNEMLDITDGYGNFVPMTNSDRRSFLMALGLHAVGKERVLSQNDNNETKNEKNDDDEKNNSNSNALIFLLQADDEWNSLDDSWRRRVDNYGLLQLDICWEYLRAQCLDYLSDVIQRLERAERVLRSQVDVNFITLSLVQAEMGNPVPAASAIFVRLFLLQGVVYRYYRGNGNAAMLEIYQKKSKERLDWAWALAKSLREVSSPEMVEQLIAIVGGISGKTMTNFQAISALRRTNGNINRAAETIQNDSQQIEQAEEDRLRQNKLGLCQNGKQYVDLQLLKQLQISLDIELPPSTNNTNQEGDGRYRNDKTKGIDEMTTILSGILRLCNNDLGMAIDMYQEYLHNPTVVLQRLEELDVSQGRCSRKRKYTKVDDMALMSLISMTGVSTEAAKRALLSTNSSVDQALLWLSIDSNRHSGTSKSEPIENSAVKVDTGIIVTPGEKCCTSNNELIDNSAVKKVDTGVDNPTNKQSLLSLPTAGKCSKFPSLLMHNAAELARERAEKEAKQAEREAMQSLRKLLSSALEKQDRSGDGYLGIALDEEWSYIIQFRTIE